jgi:hypothetical protein
VLELHQVLPEVTAKGVKEEEQEEEEARCPIELLVLTCRMCARLLLTCRLLLLRLVLSQKMKMISRLPHCSIVPHIFARIALMMNVKYLND